MYGKPFGNPRTILRQFTSLDEVKIGQGLPRDENLRKLNDSRTGRKATDNQSIIEAGLSVRREREWGVGWGTNPH